MSAFSSISIFLICYFMISCKGTLVNMDYIRHGDMVSISYWSVNSNTSIVNVNKVDPYIPLMKSGEFATFRIYKKPYYKSDKNVLITGKSVELVWRNRTCGVMSGGTLSCIGSSYANETLRILQKHGGDGQYMSNGNYIKFRTDKKSVDCFANGKTMNCWKKKRANDLYGFVIFKNV